MMKIGKNLQQPKKKKTDFHAERINIEVKHASKPNTIFY